MSTAKADIVHNRLQGVAVLLGSALLLPGEALAIPPPDFVVNAGLQIAQAVGIAMFFCSAGLGVAYRRFRSMFQTPLRRAFGLAIIVSGFAFACYLIFNT